MAGCYRKCAFFLIFIFVFSLIGMPVQAAENEIKITTKTGFDGKVKTGRGFPVQVTIENNGKDFKGDLLVNFYPTYNSTGSKVLHIDVPKGSTKTFNVSLQGLSEENQYNNQNVQSLFLYEGSWKNGKEVGFRGSKNLSPRYTDPERKTLGLLSENPDRLKELKSLPSDAMIDTIVMDESILPEDRLGLDLIDYLVIDEYPFSSLKPAQQEAILEWVKNGGILIAGGAPDAVQAYGSLIHDLPMEPVNEAEANLTGLKSAIKPGKELEKVPVFYGKTKADSEIVYKSGDIPIVAKRISGSGEIWQTAFSAGAQPIASWKGYGDWLAFLLSQSHVSTNVTSQGFINPYEQYYMDFAEVNSYFPSSHFSLGQIFLMLLAYVVLIAPALYFALKKWDRREQAWWIIPSFALLCSAAIFGIGAKDRIASPQVSQIGVFKAEGGQLQGIKAVSLLSNTSGDYGFAFPRGEFSGIPESSYNSPKHFSVFESGRKEDIVTFPNVEYWATRTLYGPATKKEAGEFVMDLKFAGSKLTGTIENRFPYDFENVYVWSGSKQIKLGKLDKGGSLKVHETLGQNYLSGPLTPGYGHQMPSTAQDIPKMKKSKLEYGAVEFLYNKSRLRNIPIVYGFTKDPVVNADLTGQSEKSTSVSLIYQAAEIEMEMSGPFSLKEEELSADLVAIKGEVFEVPRGGREASIDVGQYEYILHVPSQLNKDSTRFEEISVTLIPGNAVFSLINAETGESIKLTDKTTKFTDKPGRFITKDGLIKIKLEKTGQNDPFVRMPSVTIKGVAGK
ncbi:hypothetical protein D1B31_17125 [Neobacillus notoginsengisoli]|uniref:DUF4350 domain-containing protein n=1 Tax=Neobacillus notoginsengisoli TaxID=1578198 RepID=A0A417YQB5_9BACI|nr:hypothetical protein D1B31_17125 [Neobacillus notoginsengisoli]